MPEVVVVEAVSFRRRDLELADFAGSRELDALVGDVGEQAGLIQPAQHAGDGRGGNVQALGQGGSADTFRAAVEASADCLRQIRDAWNFTFARDDPDRRAKMATFGREKFVRELAWHDQASKYVQVYDALREQ